MNKGRTFKTVGAGIAVSAVLAACGGGGGGAKAPSALDPANMVPGTSVIYLTATVRPQGSTAKNLIEAVDSIAGKGTARRLSAKLEKSLGRKAAQVKAWAGQRIGLALTGLPSTVASGPAAGQSFLPYLLLVIPTNDPSAARAWLAKQNLGASTGKVVGHYVILGGSTAFGAAMATTAKTSLASDPSFQADTGQLGQGGLFTAYVPLHQLYEQALPLLRQLPQFSGSSALAQGAKQAPPGSSAAIGVEALHNQFRMDLVEHGMPHSTTPPVSGVASDVSALPGGSWLAMTLGGALAKAGSVSQMAAGLSRSIATLQAASGIAGNALHSGPLNFIVRDLVPALGPMELSVSGTSTSTLQAGLVMAPVNRGAGARLAAAVKRLVRGLPVSASVTGGRVAVTFGFGNLQQLLAPSSTLADNPAFKDALAQLPAGAKAGLYLNFSGIAALAALDPSAANNGSAMRVLHRLDYLIAGGTHSHFRLVLATH